MAPVSMTIHYTPDSILCCFITATLIRETFTSENGGDTDASPAPINHNEFQARVPFDVYHGQ